MPRWTKQDFFDILDERAYTLAAWCIEAKTDDAKVVAYLLDQFDTLDPTKPLFINKILPILLDEKIISEEIFNTIHDRILTPEANRVRIIKRYKKDGDD